MATICSLTVFFIGLILQRTRGYLLCGSYMRGCSESNLRLLAVGGAIIDGYFPNSSHTSLLCKKNNFEKLK